MLISLVLSLLPVFPLSISGCDSEAEGIDSYLEDSKEGYKIITVVTDEYSFSFEYSTYYSERVKNIHPEYERACSIVELLVPKATVDLIVPAGDSGLKTVSASYRPAYIAVYVSDSTLNNKRAGVTATERLNGRLKSEEDKWDNFKLIEHSTIIVSGIEGDYAEWEVDWFNLFANKSDEPPLEYRRQVSFDFKGLIWKIEALSLGPELKDQIKADFEHILETFEIFD